MQRAFPNTTNEKETTTNRHEFSRGTFTATGTSGYDHAALLKKRGYGGGDGPSTTPRSSGILIKYQSLLRLRLLLSHKIVAAAAPPTDPFLTSRDRR